MRAPVGIDHFLDETELDAVGGPEATQVRVETGVQSLADLIIEDDAAGEHGMTHGIPSGALLAFDRAVGERHWLADLSLRSDDILLNSRIERGYAGTMVKYFVLIAKSLVNGTMGKARIIWGLHLYRALPPGRCRSCADAIQENTQVAVPLEEALKNMQVVERVLGCGEL